MTRYCIAGIMYSVDDPRHKITVRKAWTSWTNQHNKPGVKTQAGAQREKEDEREDKQSFDDALDFIKLLEKAV